VGFGWYWQREALEFAGNRTVFPWRTAPLWHFIPVYTRAHAREAADGKLPLRADLLRWAYEWSMPQSSMRVRRSVGSRPRMPSEEQSLDAVAGAFPDQALALPIGATRIFLLDTRYSNDGANVALSSVDRDQGAQKREGSDPTGLHTMRPKAIHLDPRGV
jgi:hypothetical protein